MFASETGMRPSEWLAIEWRDVDRTAGVVLFERTCAYGVTKSYGKTASTRRRVPLSSRALEALDMVPRRLDVRLVFPGQRGGVIDLKNFRIDRTYGHLAQGAEEAATAKLDAAYARRLRQERVTAESGENG